MSDIQLRDYQQQAVDSFFEHEEIGLFEMATGTGKTFTALSCVKKDFENENGRQFLVIVVPYLHLIDQWIKYFPLFELETAIVVAGDKNKWYPKLKTAIWNYKRGYRHRVIVIGSYKSISSPLCKQLLNTSLDHSFLLADECHNMGQNAFLTHPLQRFTRRLGLSATPKRWQDEQGTAQVYQYFGETIYTFSMDQAIEKQYLTPYEYHPIIVDLSKEEQNEFEKITKRLVRLFQHKEENEELISKLSIRRSRILKKATYKVEHLVSLLTEQVEKKHTLIYCAEGEIDTVIEALKPLKLKISRFNSELSISERQVILEQFASGDIEVLVAIKCLDEGVDVPATKTAYFLASTSNPREFIQRRGRVLRKSEGKHQAIIYDFVVLPQVEDERLFNSIAKKEIPRCVEFSQFATNQFSARRILLEQLSPYHLDHYMELDSEGMKKFLEEQEYLG